MDKYSIHIEVEGSAFHISFVDPRDDCFSPSFFCPDVVSAHELINSLFYDVCDFEDVDYKVLFDKFQNLGSTVSFLE